MMDFNNLMKVLLHLQVLHLGLSAIWHFQFEPTLKRFHFRADEIMNHKSTFFSVALVKL